jgi:hypothetical protein
MKNQKKAVLLVILLGLVAACLAIMRKAETMPPKQELTELEDYRVYSALLQAVPSEVTGTPILIDNKIRKMGVFTESGKDLIEFYKGLLPGILQDTLVDFLARLYPFMLHSTQRQLTVRIPNVGFQQCRP